MGDLAFFLWLLNCGIPWSSEIRNAESLGAFKSSLTPYFFRVFYVIHVIIVCYYIGFLFFIACLVFIFM